MGISPSASFRRAIPRFVRERWSVKLAIAFVVVIVVLGGIGGHIYVTTGAQLTEDTQFRMQTAADMQADALSDWVGVMKNEAHAFAYAGPIQNGDSAERSAFLRQSIAENRLPAEISAVHYVDTSSFGIHASSVEGVPGENAADVGFPWATETYSPGGEEVKMSAPFENPRTGTPSIAFIAGVPDQNDRALVLVANLTMRSNEMPRPVKNSFSKVVDSEGTTVLSHKNDQILTQNMGEEGINSMAVKKGLKGSSGYMEMEMMGKQMVMGYAPVTGTDWVLMTHSTRSEMFALKNQISNNLLALLGTALLGFGLIGMTIGRNTIRSLNNLTEKANTLESGTLDVELESTRVDEFGELYSAFADMRDGLRTQIHEAETARENAKDAQENAEEARKKAEQEREQSAELVDHLEAKADAYSDTMERAADGELGVRLVTESESEAMTRIAESFNVMMEDFQAAIQEIQTFAEEVADASEEANAGAAEIRDASDDVSRSIQEISSGTDEQRRMLENAVGEMNDLSATIEEVAASAQNVAETSRQTTDVANRGEGTAEQAIDDAMKVREAIGTTVENIESLDQQMTEMGEIIELISDVAEQTNILALNANIEAARAGSGGHDGDGFGVVANEVKQLAEETQSSANEIEQLIEETQSESQAAVEEVQIADRHMQEAVGAVEDVVDAFSLVAENATETDSGVQEISEATDDQAASAEEAVSMVEEVSDISQSTAGEAESVSAAAEEQAASMSQVSSNVESLSEQADQLQALLSQFDVVTASERVDERGGHASDVVGDGGRQE